MLISDNSRVRKKYFLNKNKEVASPESVPIHLKPKGPVFRTIILYVNTVESRYLEVEGTL